MERRIEKWIWVVAVWCALVPQLTIMLFRSDAAGPNPGTFFALGMIAGLAIACGVCAGGKALTISRRQAPPDGSAPSSSSWRKSGSRAASAAPAALDPGSSPS